MNKDKTTESVNEGRYERIRAADIKRHGYTELAGRNDPKRAAVFNANTRKIARDRRLAGIVPGSANARPENRADALIHSARKSAEKRAAGKPSPRTAPKNRDRTIADSFNHGLDEKFRRALRFINRKNTNSKYASEYASEYAKDRAINRSLARGNILQTQGWSPGLGKAKREAQIHSPRTAPKNRNRTIADSFNHGLEEAKRPTMRPIKQSKNIFGAAVRGAISGMTTPKPAGTSHTNHVVRQALGNIARHVVRKFF